MTVPVFMWGTHYSCQILLKLEFSQKILKKNSNIKFHKHPSSESWKVPCQRTDRHTEANSHFLQFYECAKKYW